MELMQAQDDPITNCAHFVSRLPGGAFFTELKYEVFSIALPEDSPLHKSLLCRGLPHFPTFCSRKAEDGPAQV